LDTSPTPDLNGRICLVTGANRGIGLATSTVLARAGGHVVMVCRDEARARAVLDLVRRSAGTDLGDYLLAELSSQGSIRQLAREFERRYDRLDVLVNNAATVSELRQTTVDGRELTFAVNHLAYFLLTRLLLDRVRAAEDGVIINVAATNHRDAVDVDDLDSAEGYGSREAYMRSKLANVSFTLELARRLGPAPRVKALCPGVNATELLMQFRGVPSEQWADRLAEETPPSKAARVILALVASPGTGRYVEDGVEVAPSPMARDVEVARWLWNRCSELTGLDVDEGRSHPPGG
jgi:NAD(P)-dependent dehydrogenase (short-subunit alcohol dehydrogenase family)